MLCEDEGISAILNGSKIDGKRELEGKKKENNLWIGIKMEV